MIKSYIFVESLAHTLRGPKKEQRTKTYTI